MALIDKKIEEKPQDKELKKRENYFRRTIFQEKNMKNRWKGTKGEIVIRKQMRMRHLCG